MVQQAVRADVSAATTRHQTADSVTIKKVDQEQQVVFGEVYAPGFPDSQGDFMSAEAIRKMAYGFMQKSTLRAIDVGHDQQDCGAHIVESFIARDDDPTFIPGSWVIGVHIPDTQLWGLVKSGELNGFSLDGYGLRTEKTFSVTVPDELSGRTDVQNGHCHTFKVAFDPTGRFLGGQTDFVDGHSHAIRAGTVTEMAAGHSHRFSFVEGVLHVQDTDD